MMVYTEYALLLALHVSIVVMEFPNLIISILICIFYSFIEFCWPVMIFIWCGSFLLSFIVHFGYICIHPREYLWSLWYVLFIYVFLINVELIWVFSSSQNFNNQSLKLLYAHLLLNSKMLLDSLNTFLPPDSGQEPKSSPVNSILTFHHDLASVETVRSNRCLKAHVDQTILPRERYKLLLESL